MSTAVVVQKGDHSVGFYVVPSGQELGRIAVDQFPHEMAFNAERSLAFVSHFGVALAEDPGPGGNTISMIDLKRRSRAAVIDCGPYRKPHGLAVDAAGRLYAVSEASSMLLVADDPISGRIARAMPTGGKGSHMVSVTRDGALAFSSNMASGTLTVINTLDGDRPPQVIAVGARPEGQVLDPDEKSLFVVNRESEDISVIDVYNRKLRDRILVGPGPVRICWDDRGLLLVPLYHSRELVHVDPSGRILRRLPLGAPPISVSFDARSRAAYLSTLGQEVLIIDIPAWRLAGRFPTRTDPDPVAVFH